MRFSFQTYRIHGQILRLQAKGRAMSSYKYVYGAGLKAAKVLEDFKS